MGQGRSRDQARAPVRQDRDERHLHRRPGGGDLRGVPRVNEWLLQTLELPYRIVEKCTGDAGYLATHRQRDVEVWLPGLASTWK